MIKRESSRRGSKTADKASLLGSPKSEGWDLGGQGRRFSTYLTPVVCGVVSALSTEGLPRTSWPLIAGRAGPRTAATEVLVPLWSCAGSGPEKDLEGVSR